MSCDHRIVLAIEGDTRWFCNKCGLIPSDRQSRLDHTWAEMVEQWTSNPIIGGQNVGERQ